MYEIVNTKQYKKDTKLLSKQGKDRQKLVDVLTKLSNGISLEEKYKDHSLIGNWKGYRECHIEPDWVLIYKITNNKLYLARTGSHSELLENLNFEQLNKILNEFL